MENDNCNCTTAPDLELKPYIGTKVILAKPMHENEWLKGKNQESANRDGYLVIYSGGYRSWSPKKEFEEAYRLILDNEKNMIRF